MCMGEKKRSRKKKTHFCVHIDLHEDGGSVWWSDNNVAIVVMLQEWCVRARVRREEGTQWWGVEMRQEKKRKKRGRWLKKKGKKQPRCHSRSGPKLGKGVGGGLLVSIVRSRNAHLYACAVDGSNGCCSENQSEGSHVQVWVVTNLFFLECRGQVFRDVGDIAKGI